jgi:formylglycine-generating enzyme required for sulfatase activity
VFLHACLYHFCRENNMKNILKFLGVIALAAVMGFGLAGCIEGGDGGNGKNGKTLESISLNTEQVKKSYHKGDNLNLAGLVVTAHYSDDSSAAVTNYTASPADDAHLNTSGSQTVTVSYTEDGLTKTASFTVNVDAVTVTKIEITSPPDKTIYYFTDTAIDITGLVVKVTYSNGEIDNNAHITAEDISGFDNRQLGEQEPIITYGGKTASFTITVKLIDMAWIPAGTFMMGSPDGSGGINGSVAEPNRSTNETLHSVTLTSGYFMGKYQVTQEQWRAVMTGSANQTEPSYFTDVGAYGGEHGNLPVEQITWYDTIEFCNRLSEKEGLEPVYNLTVTTRNAAGYITVATVTVDFSKNGYRLPTEAQWEYACRAGTTTAFNWGTDQITSDQANFYATVSLYNGSPSGVDRARTTVVGSFAPNAWGLYDMHGNVWELCWDRYDADYTKSHETVMYGNVGADPAGAASGTNRVLRGGSWYSYGKDSRSAYRGYGGTGYFGTGFRLVRP